MINLPECFTESIVWLLLGWTTYMMVPGRLSFDYVRERSWPLLILGKLLGLNMAYREWHAWEMLNLFSEISGKYLETQVNNIKQKTKVFQFILVIWHPKIWISVYLKYIFPLRTIQMKYYNFKKSLDFVRNVNCNFLFFLKTNKQKNGFQLINPPFKSLYDFYL